MKRIIHIIWLVAGCYGGGPTPTAPTAVTPLFVSPSDGTCSGSVYIGAVGIGTLHGYAVTVPYVPSGPDAPDCCPGGTCPQPNDQLFQTYSFAKDGLTPAGTMQPTLPVPTNDWTNVRVAMTNGDTPVWAYASGSQLALSDGAMVAGELTGNVNGNFEPASLVADDSSIYVAGWSPNGQAVDDPTYPCCGGQGDMNGSGQSGFVQVDIANPTASPVVLPATPQFTCDTTARCLTDSPDDLIYFDSSTMAVEAMAKSSATTQQPPQQLAQLAATPIVPVGIAASSMYAAWAESHDYRTGGIGQPSCTISTWDLSSASGQPALTTSKFSCMGLAVDGATIYTAIVTPYDGDCNGCSPELLGIGIARFQVSDPMGTFEALALDLAGASGPRRLAFDSDGNLYLLDPEVVLAIDKNALAGHHDFTP